MTSRNALLLLLATAVLPFANGRWSFALAAFIGPALLLAFTRHVKRAAITGWLATSVACFFWWNGVFPLKGVAYVIASIVFGAIALTPYLIDRAVAPRLHPLLAVLVFPSAVVTLETLTMLFSPFGSWGAFAYTQFNVKSLVQLVSVFGLAGLTFLITAFASVASSRSRAAFLGYAIVLLAAFGFGYVRLQSNDATTNVRIAAITPRIPTYTVRGNAANAPIYAALQSVRKRQPIPNDAWSAFRTRAADIEHELLNASETEARNGARMVVWSEGAGIIEKQDEAAMLARAGNVARRTNAYLLLAFLTLDARGSKTFENKNVLVDPQGRAVWTYQKAHPVPGMEACVPGDGNVPVAPTPYGRVATAICFDMDFPRILRQTRADILLVPADDWREIAPRHSYMAAFRAVEQGFSLVRATSNGASIAVDRFGRVRESRDYFDGTRVMRAEVPAKGAMTSYARIGDLFPAVAAIVLIALVLLSLRRRERVREFSPALRDVQ